MWILLPSQALGWWIRRRGELVCPARGNERDEAEEREDYEYSILRHKFKYKFTALPLVRGH